VLTKHFGPPEGDPAGWPEDKRRAYGFAYRSAAWGYLQQGQPDEAWRYLARAASTYPPILERLDTFYELACGDQPRGYRGQADRLDIQANGADMLRRLAALFAADPSLRALEGVAYGHAYLALAMLSDQAGDWAAARRYLWQAAWRHPGLLSPSFLRRLLKVSAGKRAVGFLRGLRLPAAPTANGSVD